MSLPYISFYQVQYIARSYCYFTFVAAFVAYSVCLCLPLRACACLCVPVPASVCACACLCVPVPASACSCLPRLPLKLRHLCIVPASVMLTPAFGQSGEGCRTSDKSSCVLARTSEASWLCDVPSLSCLRGYLGTWQV
jgi:hypothetical protein